MTDVSIIIVNYKMKDLIVPCLESLKADVSGSSLQVHVVVVDNASNDDSCPTILSQFPDYTCLINTRNLGYGGAVNIGIRSHEAKYYFVLNPDTKFVEPRTIERLYAFMEAHPKIGMIGPKLLNVDGTLQFSCNRFPPLMIPLLRRTSLGEKKMFRRKVDRFLMRDFDHEKTQPVDWVIGSAMFVRASALKDVGFFDDRFFMYFEDTDWCRRFWEAHWPIYYVHDIVIMHHHGRGSARVPGVFRALFMNKLARLHVQSAMKYFWKWRGIKI
ncbi:MAG: putative glycosyltransferase [Candidatus Magasanikbacteria bacterium]|nr:putative glycosyltransferase [Candidatus Magasanikbacteria bacterium]